jgi:signal transduction histidine kinase
VIAVENNRLLSELRETLEQQTATAEVLKVISRSPFDLEPVLQNLLETAAKLATTEKGWIGTYDNGELKVRAGHGMSREFFDEATRIVPSAGRGTVAGRALFDGRTCHVIDTQADSNYPIHDFADRHAVRTVLAVPLMREGKPIGVIGLIRSTVRPFSQREIELTETFADQAAIAVANVKLFDTIQARTRELQQSLTYQTAISDVLGIISRSPNAVQPIFDAIVTTAGKLCDSEFAMMFRREGEAYRICANNDADPDFVAYEREHPNVPGRGTLVGRVAMEGRTVHLVDCLADPEYAYADGQKLGRYRTMLGVPLLRSGAVIGVIGLLRTAVNPFTDQQIDLVTTFANQAVIAIENARLFDALQIRTEELGRSVEELTATSDILRTIASSPGKVEPVLTAVAESAARLCAADDVIIERVEGNELRFAANCAPLWGTLVAEGVRVSIAPTSIAGRAILERRTIHVEDIKAVAAEYPDSPAVRFDGVRTILMVPLLREGVPIGTIAAVRSEVRPFSDKQIELVKSFADQAVIAIENARLLGEVQTRTDELARSVEELRALDEVGRAVSSTLDLRTVLDTVVDRAIALGEADGCSIYRYKRHTREFLLWHAVGIDPTMEAGVRALHINEDQTIMGKAVHSHEPVQVPDLALLPPAPLRDLSIAAGYRAVLIVPLVRADRIFGALVLQRRRVGAFAESTVNLLRTFASQSSLAIQNARLFREIEEKGRQIEMASQHKSQFMANMSHELRTPLNAILGYTELMLDGLYGDVGDKARSVLERVQSNGRHLLGLINDVLDLAKIEAGQLTLAVGDYSVNAVVQSVIAATESLARAKGLSLTADVVSALPDGHGDERRLTQVLLNVVGNAIKFTDTGSVTIAANASDGFFTIGVTDTGPGIPAEDQGRIFEEFQQVDNSSTRKKGGTGLGLAISKRIVEMHGGTIKVESEVGRGSTFLIHLPIQAVAAKEVA